MKLEGTTTEMMVQKVLDFYDKYLHKNADGKPVLVVQLTRSIYGCVKSSMFF